jgi:hypothetical protein
MKTNPLLAFDMMGGSWWPVIDEMRPLLAFEAMKRQVAAGGGEEFPPHVWGDRGAVMAAGGQEESPPRIWGEERAVVVGGR